MAKLSEVPGVAVKRLFLYYRALLESRKTDVISSDELSKMTGSSAAQIRKDLTYFGEFGIPGKGYNVDTLNYQLKEILGINREWDVVLIGIGNLGKAIASYQGLKLQGFRVSYIFDSDPNKIGKKYGGILIHDLKEIKMVLDNSGTRERIAVITVPAIAAQEVASMVIEAGLKAILNFAPTRISVPESIKILNIDMTNELSRLSYFLTRGLQARENSNEIETKNSSPNANSSPKNVNQDIPITNTI